MSPNTNNNWSEGVVVGERIDEGEGEYILYMKDIYM